MRNTMKIYLPLMRLTKVKKVVQRAVIQRMTGKETNRKLSPPGSIKT